MSNTTETVLQDAAQVLLTLVPALNPYSTAITTAFSVVSATAPAVYTEITALIHRIKNGGEATEEDKAKLMALVASLKNPDAYFAK